MKNVIVFGANGYIAKRFMGFSEEKYKFTTVSRQQFDFLDPDYEKLDDHIRRKATTAGYQAAIFLQGINPRVGVEEIDEKSFHDMIKINLSTPMGVVKTLKPLLTDSASVVFMSSIARRKGSYDPSYATAKAGLEGMVQTLSNNYRHLRFNCLSIGLVKGSPVHVGMTPDFVSRHKSSMGGDLVCPSDVCRSLEFLIECKSINRTTVDVDRGFRV